MKKIVGLILVFLVAFLQVSCAQTQETHEHKNMQGQIVESPYITHSELESITIDGRVRLEKLLIVSSIDEVTQMLGEPQNTKITEINAGGYKEEVSLIYSGMEVTFLEAAGKIRLKEFKITSPDRFVQIGEKKVRPGMEASTLSEAVYNDYKKAAKKSGKKSSNVYIQVAEEGAKSGGEMRFDRYTDIEITFDEETGTVTRFRIFRVI